MERTLEDTEVRIVSLHMIRRSVKDETCLERLQWNMVFGQWCPRRPGIFGQFNQVKSWGLMLFLRQVWLRLFVSYPIIWGATLPPTGLGPGWLVFWWDLALVACGSMMASASKNHKKFIGFKSLVPCCFLKASHSSSGEACGPVQGPPSCAVFGCPASKRWWHWRSLNDPWDQQNSCSNWPRLVMKTETNDLRQTSIPPFHSRNPY